MPTQNAVIYARYSSSSQRDVSIEQQIRSCRAYAESNGLTVLRIYDDHAMTGKNDNRPGFQQMIRDSAARSFQYVIVYALDRFSRNKYDSAVHKHTLKENGVRVVSATEHISDDPTGILMESILEGFAQYYSEELSQKIRRGYRNNAEKRMVIGHPPFGYTRGPDNRYQVVPAEAAIVQEIFSRVAAGEQFVSIFRDLNARGIPNKLGGKWSRSSFTKILHNEKYIGVYAYDDIRDTDAIPKIIDNDLFLRVQEHCRRKPCAQSPQKRRRDNSVYLLTGKLFCGKCNGPMVGISGTSKSGTLHHYYACQNHRNHKCDMRQWPREMIEETIAGKIKALISSPEMVSWLADSVTDYLRASQEDEDLKLLRDRLSKIGKEKENVFKAIRSGFVDEDIQSMYESLKSEESSLKGKLIIAESNLHMDITPEHVIAFIEQFTDGDITDKQYQEQLIDAFLLRAYVFDDHLHLVIRYSGDHSETDVPLEAQQLLCRLDANPPPGSSGVRIRDPDVHHLHLIRTHMLCIMVTSLIRGQNKACR